MRPGVRRCRGRRGPPRRPASKAEKPRLSLPGSLFSPVGTRAQSRWGSPAKTQGSCVWPTWSAALLPGRSWEPKKQKVTLGCVSGQDGEGSAWGGWDGLQTGRLVETTSKATRTQVWIGGSVTCPGRSPATELRAASGFALAARHLDPRWQQAQGEEGQRQLSKSLQTATRAPATTGAVVSLSGPMTRQQLRTAPRQAWVGGSQHLLDYLTAHPRVQFQQFLGPGLVEDLGSRQQSASWEAARKTPEAERLWGLSPSNQDRPLQGARRHTAPDTLGTVSPPPSPNLSPLQCKWGR